MKIYAPVKDFNGKRGNVQFVNGVGETDDPKQIEWFRTHGYDVPIEDEEQNLVFSPQAETVVVEEDETVEMMGYAEKPRTLEEMTPNELRELAKANGKGSRIKNIRSKEKLIEILRG